MIDVGESIGLHNDCSNAAPWQSQQHELPLRLACSMTSRGKWLCHIGHGALDELPGNLALK